jgi:hypothetical protein
MQRVKDAKVQALMCVSYRLAQVILSHIICFNRRRSGEAARLLLEDYTRIVVKEKCER